MIANDIEVKFKTYKLAALFGMIMRKGEFYNTNRHSSNSSAHVRIYVFKYVC